MNPVAVRWGRRVALPGAALLAVLLSGCGVSRCAVSGVVKYRGKPVVCGAVTFFGSDGIPVTAALKSDGTYEATGVPVGAVRVAIHSLDPARPLNPEIGVNLGEGGLDAAADPRAKKKPAGKPGDRSNWSNPEVDRSKWFPIPAKYERPDLSGLTRELRRGTNQVDFDLE
jgi:hypothetical protein